MADPGMPSDVTTQMDFIEAVRTLIRGHAESDPFEKYRNAGEIMLYEDSADAKVLILVPLPYLADAELTTGDVERALEEIRPAGIAIEVDIPQSSMKP